MSWECRECGHSTPWTARPETDEGHVIDFFRHSAADPPYRRCSSHARRPMFAHPVTTITAFAHPAAVIAGVMPW